jgi:hypothetical protein
VLTGVYPEDARNTSITDIREPTNSELWPEGLPPLIKPATTWWHVVETPAIDKNNFKVSGSIEVNGCW